jgi:hypothetical protein
MSSLPIINCFVKISNIQEYEDFINCFYKKNNIKFSVYSPKTPLFFIKSNKNVFYCLLPDAQKQYIKCYNIYYQQFDSLRDYLDSNIVDDRVKKSFIKSYLSRKS